MTKEVWSKHKERLRVVATMLAHAVFHDLTPGLHLTRPLLKQVRSWLVNPVAIFTV